MPPERWQQLKDLFHSALAVDPGQRAAFLGRACAGDPSLREEIEGLLASDEAAEAFIETPAFEMAAESLAGRPVEADISRRGKAAERDSPRAAEVTRDPRPG